MTDLRRVRALGLLFVIAGALSTPAYPAEAINRVELPSAAANIRAQIRAEKLLRGGKGPERTLPGPVRDDEVVRVLVTPDGRPVVVHVRQLLTLAGIGDYFFRIPGPVLDVEALPRSTAQPGLRAGSVVWQGFANEKEVLAADLALSPEQEATKLPLDLRVETFVDGEAITKDNLPPGRLRMKVTAKNATGTAVALPSSGAAAVPRLARALDSLRGILKDEHLPVPGERGLPRSLPVAGKVDEIEAQISAPLQLKIGVVLPEDSKGVLVNGRREDRPNTVVSTSALLSGSRHELALDIQATTPGGKPPEIAIAASPGVPSPAEVRPARGVSWVRAAAHSDVSTREMLNTLATVLAEAAATPQVDGYLGNPDRDGKTASLYRFNVVYAAPEKPPPSVEAPKKDGASTWSVVGTVASLVVLLLLLTLAWARS